MIFHSVLWMIRQFTIYWYKHIFQKRADISWSLLICLWFFCQSIAQIKVLKDNRQQCLYELMKMKKKIIIHISYSPASSPSLCNGFYNVFRKIWQFDFFFIFQVCQYLDKINPFSKRKSIICFINNTFSNRYCLISSQYAGNVLILQTVF